MSRSNPPSYMIHISVKFIQRYNQSDVCLAFLSSLWWLGMESPSIHCTLGVGHLFDPLSSEGELGHPLLGSAEIGGASAWKLQMPIPNLRVN